MKIFLTGTSLLAEYGGPAFSVSRLAAALVEMDINVGLWAADQSALKTTLIPAASPVRRMGGTMSSALHRFGRPDILHDNGMWLMHNHESAVIARKRGIPRVVSTRGMIEPWARNHKRFRKRLAWMVYQRRDLRDAQCHHATADAEARSLGLLRLGVPIQTVPNGVDLPPRLFRPDNSRWPLSNGRRTALFLGRICPSKGLPMLVSAWGRLRPEGWQLCIAGPDEAGHRKEVQRAIDAAGLNRDISFAGPVEGRMKDEILFNADLFVLPSYSENFGIAIAEALAHGVPVLTTTATPWSALRDRGCGWWVAPTVDAIAGGLHEALGRDRRTLRMMGANGKALVMSEFTWNRVARLMLSLYESVVAGACCTTYSWSRSDEII
jgi:glycosyltransferase involved in cell wall biosynthesis